MLHGVSRKSTMNHGLIWPSVVHTFVCLSVPKSYNFLLLSEHLFPSDSLRQVFYFFLFYSDYVEKPFFLERYLLFRLSCTSIGCMVVDWLVCLVGRLHFQRSNLCTRSFKHPPPFLEPFSQPPPPPRAPVTNPWTTTSPGKKLL